MSSSSGTSSSAVKGGGNSTGGATTGGAATSTGGATTGGAATTSSIQMPSTAPGGPSSGAGALTASDVTSGGVGGNLATPTGTIGSGATGGVLSSSDLRISGAQGPEPSLVRLKDVARVELGATNYNQNATFDQKPAAGVTVFQLPGTNALDVAKRVRDQVEILKQDFPPWIHCVIGYDTTPYITESINDVVNTLLLAIALVGLVVLLFLQDWRAMILPMIDVPVSLIGTFAVMAALGFTLNNISLFGLVLAIGIVVDDAIVVLENIERQMAKGLDTRTATIKAMEEITGPIIAITLVLCAVFVPCAFIPGVTGRFFRQFAVTISASMIISAINAITMTPSRALAIFKSQEGQHGHEHKREALPWWFFGIAGGLLTVIFWTSLPVRPAGLPELPSGEAEGQPAMPTWLYWTIVAVHFLPGMAVGLVFGWFTIRPINVALSWFFRLFNRLFDLLTAAYSWTIGLALHASAVVLVMYAVLLGLTVWVLSQVHLGFIPQQDQGRLIASVQLPDATSLKQTQAVLDQFEAIAHNTKGIKHTITNAGSSFVAQANASNVGSMFIILESFAERRNDPEKSAAFILNKLKQEAAKNIKEAKITINPAAPIPGLGTAGGFRFVVKDNSGLEPAELEKATLDLVDVLNQERGLKDVITTYRSATPQLLLTVDRTKAAALGVALNDVNQTLQMYLGSVSVNFFNEFGRHWQVTVQAESTYRAQTEDIGRLQVRNNKGEMVPLSTLVKVVPRNGPLAVQRYNLRPAASVNGNIKDGVSSGEVIATVEDKARQLPPTTGMEWTDQMFLQKQAGNGAMFIFGLAVLCVFLALAAQYESWTMPLAVILVVPLCVLCSLLGVRYTTNSVDIFVQIGLVVLVGLACKNAILVVEFAQQLHRQGLSRFEAAREAAGQRLRPILMTSFAFIAGVVPLVLARGAGAEMRQSLGTAVFCGMIGVTFFGIFLTPVFFSVIQGIGDRPIFATTRSRQIVTGLAGGLVGLVFGGLLAGLGAVPFIWGLIVGATAGAVGALAVLGLQQWVQFTRNRSE
jgi:multidrug efflux pump